MSQKSRNQKRRKRKQERVSRYVAQWIYENTHLWASTVRDGTLRERSDFEPTLRGIYKRILKKKISKSEIAIHLTDSDSLTRKFVQDSL